jgi:hypothetical protein
VTPVTPAAYAERGFWRTYLFSTDHKTIGRQYLVPSEPSRARRS